jgi:hypothetical protein
VGLGYAAYRSPIQTGTVRLDQYGSRDERGHRC